MNGTMEQSGPTVINQILDLNAFFIFRAIFAHILRSYNFFGSIQGVVLVLSHG
jgi:hypothetical protein